MNRCFDKKDDADKAQKSKSGQPPVPESEPAPRSDESVPAGDSSSRSSQIDLSPPDSDKGRPAEAPDDVTEFHPYDPHKAAKDVEVGDFYFEHRNYGAAYSRYQEALQFKPNDAIATFKLAQTAEKMGKLDEAIAGYQSYLKILPRGPEAEAARAALERLQKAEPAPVANKH